MRAQSKIAKPVKYLKKLDTEMVYRLGKEDDNRMSRIRHFEDDRPMAKVNRRTNTVIPKRNEIITYKENNKLYVLGKSGGVSLFDAISPKLTLGRKDCWYLLPKSVNIPKEIVIAKNIDVDTNGHFHYSFQPANDMLMLDFERSLAEIGAEMRIV